MNKIYNSVIYILLQTNDYNYLSVISRENNVSVNCIIKDNLY
jgi:hypothetical protein